MNTTKMKQKIEKKIDQIILGKMKISLVPGKSRYSAEDAAVKFIKVLSDEIDNHVGSDYSSGEFSALAREVMEGIGYNEPRKVGDHYEVDIYFSKDLHRESLYPKDKEGHPTPYADGIDNIVALLNSGYSTGSSVYGVWVNHKGEATKDELGNDKKIPSLRRRGGAGFIEQAISDFMGNYAGDYNVTQIIPSEEYSIRDE